MKRSGLLIIFFRESFGFCLAEGGLDEAAEASETVGGDLQKEGNRREECWADLTVSTVGLNGCYECDCECRKHQPVQK